MRIGLGLGVPAIGGGGVIPALDLLFVNGENLDSRIVFGRDSVATRINAAGAIENVASGNPRFDYSPTSIGTLRGLLIEEQRTNLLLNSFVDGTGLSTQNVTVMAQSYTLSFYGTGTVTLSGASTAGPLVGTGAYPNRVALTFTPSAGTLALTVSGSVRWAQLEAGSFATSHIPTTGSQVTRSADSASITSTAFSNFFNAAEGTFLIKFDRLAQVNGSQILRAYDGTNNNRIMFYNPGSLAAIVSAGGSTQALLALGSIVADTDVCAAIAYKDNDFAATSNGVSIQTDSFGSVPIVDRLSFEPNGHFKRVAYYRSRLANDALTCLIHEPAAHWCFGFGGSVAA